MQRGKVSIVMLVMLLIVGVLAGCSGGGGGGGGTGTGTGTGTTPTSGGTGTGGGTTTGPAISGFDFVFATGNFWEFKWDYYENIWAQGSSATTTRDAGQFWVVLGQTSQIQDVTCYEILTYGKSNKRESIGTLKSFGPRWKYVALSENKIYGSTDGATLTEIFNAATGKWPGGGFFTTFPGSTLNIAQNGTISTYNTYVSGTVIVAERSSSQSECETIASITICGDSSYDYNEEEYYRPNIGPVGYYYYNASSYSGGGFSSGVTWRHNVGLTGSFFTGQTNPLVNESEPNDSPVTAQTITKTNPIMGTVSQSTLANQGNTVITVTVDPDGSAPPQSYSPTVEDWYTFTLSSAQTVTITLSFEERADADLDLFLMKSNGTLLATSTSYSVHDNLVAVDQHEVIKVVSLPLGTYHIGVDGYITPTSAVKYTLQLE